MQSDYDLKIHLLRTEIVDQGFNTEEFEDFVVQIRPDCGADIDKWTFEQLRDCVTQFKQIKDVPDTDNFEIIIGEPQSHSYINTNFGSEFTLERQVIKQERTAVDDPETEITINGYQKVSGWFYQCSYIAYNLETQPQGWKVSRRYSDFVWLREQLSNLHPTLAVPPVPGKRRWTFDEAYIEKRRQFLERFLRNLLLHQVLRNDWLVQSFLMQNDRDFSVTKKLIVALNFSNNQSLQVDRATNLRTMTGVIQYIFIQKSVVAIAKYDTLYAKLRKLCRQLSQQQKQLSNTLYGIGEIFGQFYSASSEYNEGLNINQNFSIEEKYLALNNMMVTWGNVVNNEIRQTNDHLSNFLKFFHHQTRDLMKQIEKREAAKKDFMEQYEILDHKKQVLYISKDKAKWEIPSNVQYVLEDQEDVMSKMLPKETQMVFNLKCYYGVHTDQCCSEIKRVFEDQMRQFQSHYVLYCRAQAERIAESHKQWENTITSLETQGLVNMKLMQQRNHPVSELIIEGLS